MSRKVIMAALFAFMSINVSGQTAEEENCFSILAGRLTTTDGSILFAHNEDDKGEQMMNVYNVPADPEGGTLGYKWIEFPGMKVADCFMNEKGVCICSDSCGSREDCEPGSWLYELRTYVARHAGTAREAMEMIGRAVEKYGYHDSGRSYMVADANEGWIVSVVKGHHWVAMRVPDDKVLVIPNYYVIDRVDMADRDNFAGSADLVDYAITRGWYDPARDGEFSFRKSYGRPSSFTSAHNIDRHKAVLAALTGGAYDYDVRTVEPMITPSRKLQVSDLTAALSLHGEDDGSGRHMENVCLDRTVVSLVFQLRRDMPRECGCLMWMCPGRPCAEAYLPVYLGASGLPADFSRYTDASEAFDRHFTDAGDFRTNHPVSFYWSQADRWQYLSEDYAGRIAQRQKERDADQARINAAQARLDRKLVKMSPEKASRKMSALIDRCASLVR